MSLLSCGSTQSVDDEWELMNKLVLAFLATAFQLGNHASTYAFRHPDIAVDDPDKIANSLTIGTAHVADLWVWSQLGVSILESHVLILNENLCVE